MVQSGRSLRLSLEAAQCLQIFRDSLRKELKSDKPAQARVLCLVHHAHPTATKSF